MRLRHSDRGSRPVVNEETVTVDSEYLVDPELVPMLAYFPARSISAETLPEVRAGLGRLATPASDRSRVKTNQHFVSGWEDAPEVRVVVTVPVEPSSVPTPALLWVHGGGYVLGRPEQNQALVDLLVEALGCVVVAVDHRLAPEHPHPAPVDDCYAALRWMHENAGDLRLDPARIAVAGESAGGGLAAALALLARDRGDLPISFLGLVYPMIDDRTTVTPDPNPFTGQYVWPPDSNRFGWASLLGHAPGGDHVSIYAAAARAEDLSGLPPTFVSVGALDLFLDEDVEFAHRLVRSGVPTELHVYPGAFHGVLNLEGTAVSARARGDLTDALRRSFGS
jgi:acetyl esterase/lipase